jgi:hypothetical protein
MLLRHDFDCLGYKDDGQYDQYDGDFHGKTSVG